MPQLWWLCSPDPGGLEQQNNINRSLAILGSSIESLCNIRNHRMKVVATNKQGKINITRAELGDSDKKNVYFKSIRP